LGRNSNVLISLAAATLLLGCRETHAATRVSPRRTQARSAGSKPAHRSAAIGVTPRAHKGGPRLCAAARGPEGADSVEKAALEIPDLRTQANVATVVQALQDLKGVKTAIIDLNTHLAVVDYDPRVTELDHFLAACKEAGFDASEYRVESRFPKPIKLKGG